MKDRKQIPLPSNAEQLPMFLNAARVLRLEMAKTQSGYKEGVVNALTVKSNIMVKAHVDYDTNGDAGLNLYFDKDKGAWLTASGSRKLVCYEAEVKAPATPVQHSPAKPEPALKKDEFSERGVLPSDVQGINEMVKRMFKEKRDETKPAPVKPTSHAGLLITASEKYLGLGFNDEMGAP